MPNDRINAVIVGDAVVAERSETVRDELDLIVNKRFFGLLSGSNATFSPVEAFYLFDEGILSVYSKSSAMSRADLLKRFVRMDKRFVERYSVFRDLRDRGYFLRPALKYGADFAVYDKGDKPGTSHSKWLLFIVRESDSGYWRDWVAKNRVAHSVRKRILLAIVDDSSDVTYYESEWTRP